MKAAKITDVLREVAAIRKPRNKMVQNGNISYAVKATDHDRLLQADGLDWEVTDMLQGNFSRDELLKIFKVEKTKANHTYLCMPRNGVREGLRLDHGTLDALMNHFKDNKKCYYEDTMHLELTEYYNEQELNEFILKCNHLEYQGFFRIKTTRNSTGRVLMRVSRGKSEMVWVMKELIDKYLRRRRYV